MNLYQLWLISDKKPLAPDCFIVTSYALKDKDTPTSMTRAQIETAVSCHRLFLKAKVIFSTGDTQGLGIPDSKVIALVAYLFPASYSTLRMTGHVLQSLEWMVVS